MTRQDFWKQFDTRLARTAELAERDGIAREGSIRIREFALALWHDEDDVALRLISNGLDLSEAYHYCAPADWAAGLGKVHVLAEVLRRGGADIDVPNALRTAVCCGRRESVEFLLSRGASVELGKIDTPLVVACEFGNPQMVELLIAHGADVNQRNPHLATTPLMTAASYGGFVPRKPDALFAHTLIYSAALPGFTGRRIQDLAVQPDFVAVVESLIRHGADLSARDENGLTALDYAAGRRSTPRGVIENGDDSDPAIVDLLRGSARGGGCYVATAVYGSHDCEEVLVLRGYRDRRLANTSAGRAVIGTYYALSPHLVRLVGRRRWFLIGARRLLDAVVSRLRSAGY